MIVICKRPTKRLIKGVRYEVEGLWNDGKNQRWIEGKLMLKGAGKFSVANFTDENGNEVPKINIARPIEPVIRLKFSDLKEGDILVCTSGNYKTLLQGGMYRIEKLFSVSSQVPGWNGAMHTRTEEHVKFEGVKRKLKFSPWHFRKLSAGEARELSLSELLNGEAAPIIRSQNIKKIDMVDNKDQVLMEVIARSIVDPNRHHLSITEWGCEKVATKMSLVKEDFEYLMDKPLREILRLIETNTK